MNRLRSLVVCAGSSLGVLLASVALAAPPAVLDRVPDNALMVVGLPSADGLHKNLSSLMTAVEAPLPMPEVSDLLAMGGITGGLDTTKPVALVVYAPKKDAAAGVKAAADKVEKDAKKAVDGAMGGDDADDDEDADEDDGETDQVVALLPITKYEEFLANFNAKPGEAGAIDAVVTPEGVDAFVKDIGGGYVAMSDDRDLLGKFVAKSGDNPITKKLGKTGESVTESSDVFFIVNAEVVRPMWPEIKKDMQEEVKAQAEMMPMGEDVNPFENAAVEWLFDSAVRDGRALVGGVRTGNKGMFLDLAVNFTEGTPMAKLFAGGGKTKDLLSKLPGGDYLFAMALDTSNAEMKGFAKEFMAKSAAPGEEPMLSAQAIDNADGQSLVMGLPKGGIIGGLMTGMVNYSKARDVGAYVKTIKDDVIRNHGKTVGGMAYEGKYVEKGAKVDDVDVDVWDIKLTPDGSNAGGDQAMAMMFGPSGGPNGYVARVPDGTYRTFSKSSDLMSAALKTHKGGEGLASDKLLDQTAAALPGNRFAEAYIGTKGIMDLVLPFAAMAGVQIPAESVPDKLPPIAAGMSGEGGGVRMAIFVPTPVLKTVVSIGMAVQEQMDGAFEGGDAGDAPPDGGKPGTGQPRF